MTEYIPVFLFTVVALLSPFLAVGMAWVIRAGKADPVKLEPYECGIESATFAHDNRFSIRYYLIAVLFVVFDVETVFLYPWAVVYRKLALFGLVEMFIFWAF